MIAALGVWVGLAAPAPADMVAFPAGEFVMGCEGKLPACDDDEKPIRRITLSAFALDRDLVRVGDYLKCVQAKVCKPPPLFYKPEDRAQKAMTELTWAEAQAYCAWKGRRLPTEAEWARAARGTEGRTYVNPQGRGGGTPGGVQAMMGEVKQWVADWYDPEGHARLAAKDPSGLPHGTRRTVRSLEGLFGPGRAAFRASRHPDRRDHNVGFRCALDQGPRTLTPSALKGPAAGAPWPVAAISLGEVHTCALDGAGRAWCWGNDTFGQLGPHRRDRKGTDHRLRPWQVPHLPPLDALDSGPLTTCGRAKASGLLTCWGKRRAGGWVGDFSVGGQVCAVTAPPRPEPGVRAMRFDGDHLPPRPMPPGLLACAGNPDLGDGGPLTPLGDAEQPVPALRGLAGGHDHTCGIDAEGDVWCWGENGTGQLGLPEDGPGAPPRKGFAARVWPHPVKAGVHDEYSQKVWAKLRPAAALALGSHTTCALLTRGAVACWGRGTYGMLGLPFERGTGLRADALGPLEWPRPLPVPGIDDAQALAAGANHACVIRKGGAVWCWGDNTGGQLGDGTVTSRSAPAPAQGLPGPATAVSAAHGHTCAILADGKGLWCWGQNDHGQLGDGTRISRRAPVAVAAP